MKAKIIVGGLLVVLSLLIFVGIQYYVSVTPDYSAIEEITNNMDGRGVLYKNENTVCVTSADDVGYVLKKNSINIHYGKILIKVPYKAITNKEFMSKLEEVGIKIYVNTKGETTLYKITYKDEEITEWAYVS